MIEFFDIRPRLGLRIWGHIWGLEAIRLGCVLAFHAKFRVYAVITLILSTMCSQGGGNPGPVIPADSTSSASANAVCYARTHALIHFWSSVPHCRMQQSLMALWQIAGVRIKILPDREMRGLLGLD